MRVLIRHMVQIMKLNYYLKIIWIKYSEIMIIILDLNQNQWKKWTVTQMCLLTTIRVISDFLKQIILES